MATEKSPVNMKSEKASDIHGFGIELNKERLTRIDRMVELYEKRVTSRLDEEYELKTRRSDRIADKVAAFGGSWTFIIIFGCFLVMWVLVENRRFEGPPTGDRIAARKAAIAAAEAAVGERT